MSQIFNLIVRHVCSLPVHHLHGASSSAQGSTRLQIRNFRGVFALYEKFEVLTVLGTGIDVDLSEGGLQ